MSQTLLTLAPEFGGTRFGPFGQGTISIGTDASRCQVVLHPSTGAQPVHAMITDTGSAWQLQPAAIGAGLFVRSGGRTTPVQSAVQLSAGDTFVIASQQGPALTVQRMAAAPGAGARGRAGGAFAGAASAAGRTTGSAFTREIWRQVESTLVTMPYGRDIYRFMTRFRTGALFRPRNLIAAAVALIGMFGFGCVSCCGAIGGLFALQ